MKMEEYDVERKETTIVIQMPLADLRLLAACGSDEFNGTNSITVSMKAAGLRLRKILAEEGLLFQSSHRIQRQSVRAIIHP